MKKCFASLAMLAVLLALPVMASDSVYGSVTVDGKIGDGEWDNAAWQELSIVKDAPEASGRIKLMNDDNYLFLLVESTDPTVCDTVSANWNAEMSIDCIEFWFTDDIAAAADATAYGTGSITACLDHLGNFSWNGGDEGARDSMQTACSTNGNTTIYEVAIPLMDGTSDIPFGLNVAINDTNDENGSRCGYVVLNEVGQWWVSPANLGTYTLAEAPVPAAETVADEAAAEATAVTTAPQTMDVVGLLALSTMLLGGTAVLTKKKQ